MKNYIDPLPRGALPRYDVNGTNCIFAFINTAKRVEILDSLHIWEITLPLHNFSEEELKEAKCLLQNKMSDADEEWLVDASPEGFCLFRIKKK